MFERVVYNNLLAGQSADGKGFFYTNPLEANTAHVRFARKTKGYPYQPIVERVEVFDCSCCPPNFTRFIGRIGEFIYDEDRDGVYINQYISSETERGNLKLTMRSGFPYDGAVHVSAAGNGTLKLRVPVWCENFTCSVNGKAVAPVCKDGYFTVKAKGTTEIELNFEMRPRFLYANENVIANSGRKAVGYGPLVLCAEGRDNGINLRNIVLSAPEPTSIERDGMFALTLPAERLHSSAALYSYQPPTREKITLKLIPYFMWANRGENDMQIWFL